MNRDDKIGSIEVAELIAMIVVFGIGFITGYYTKYEIQEKVGIQTIDKEIPKAGATLQWVQDNDGKCFNFSNNGEITPVKESSKLWYINDKGISVRLPPVDELQFLEPEVGTVYCYEYLGDNKYDLRGIK